MRNLKPRPIRTPVVKNSKYMAPGLGFVLPRLNIVESVEQPEPHNTYAIGFLSDLDVMYEDYDDLHMPPTMKR